MGLLRRARARREPWVVPGGRSSDSGAISVGASSPAGATTSEGGEWSADPGSSDCESPGANSAPQLPQNPEPSGSSLPQLAQISVAPPADRLSSAGSGASASVRADVSTDAPSPGRAGASEVPQLPQKPAPSGSSLPQLAQVCIFSLGKRRSATGAEPLAGAAFRTAVVAEARLLRWCDGHSRLGR